MKVLKNRNKIEKARRQRRVQEISKLRTENAFKAKLNNDIEQVGELLDNSDAESVDIEVDESVMDLFGRALYGEELAEFTVLQSPKEPNVFNIRRKMLSI